MIDSFDQLGKDAQKIGIGVEELQRLRYAAGLLRHRRRQAEHRRHLRSRVAMGDLNTAGAKTAAVIKEFGTGGSAQARQGTGGHRPARWQGGSADPAKSFGVSGADSPVEALKKIADQFAKMPDGIAKTSAAANYLQQGHPGRR